MHTPAVFSEDDFDSIIDFIATNPLATLVAQTNNGIEACHIPRICDGSKSSSVQ